MKKKTGKHAKDRMKADKPLKKRRKHLLKLLKQIEKNKKLLQKQVKKQKKLQEKRRLDLIEFLKNTQIPND